MFTKEQSNKLRPHARVVFVNSRTSAAIAQLINSSDGNNEANCASAAAAGGCGERVASVCVNSYSRLAAR